VRLERGVVDVDADWTGALGPFASLADVRAPAASLVGTSGFATFDLSPLRTTTVGVPLAAGVTVEHWLSSVVGPVSVRVPAGRDDLELHAPLSDSVPTAQVIAACGELATLFAVAVQRAPDVCRIQLPLVPPIEIDTWVEANELRGAARRNAATGDAPDVVTPVARELGDGTWSLALWGRGTVLASSTATPLPASAALGLRAAALLGELGVAARVSSTGMHVRLYVRTAWANPPDLMRRYVGIQAADIASGAGAITARELVAQSPTAPLAGDLAAGTGGLVLPATLLGSVSVLIPAIVAAITGSDEPRTPFQQREAVSTLVRRYTYEAYPRWQAANPGKQCPPSLASLRAVIVPPLEAQDLWNHELGFECSNEGLVVFSLGPDGQRGTNDDITSVRSP
jgi:hypothetical protein